jgi:hypothetical protein
VAVECRICHFRVIALWRSVLILFWHSGHLYARGEIVSNVRPHSGHVFCFGVK